MPQPATWEPVPVYVPVAAGTFQEVALYVGNPPNFRANAPAEVDQADGHVLDVSVPTLRRYPMDATQSTGTAFIVFPGGAYTKLDMGRHAVALANKMGPLGVAVFGLKYRVGDGSNDVPRDALLDAKRAVRLVRAHAAEWGVAPNQVAVVGYSAGSHLALTLAGTFDAGQVASTDPVERQSCRPDFMATMCPWDHGHSTSSFKFLANTPPTYICHAEDDPTSPIAISRDIEKQLSALKILEHLEVYASGGHDAFNVGTPDAPGRDWPDKFMPWLRTNQLAP